MINAKNRVTNYNLVSIGSLDASIVEPREVFRPAVVSCAKSILLIHNHPSGNTDPSSEDIKLTSRMIEAGKILGIQLLDHIIISSNMDSQSLCSLRETGRVMF